MPLLHFTGKEARSVPPLLGTCSYMPVEFEDTSALLINQLRRSTLSETMSEYHTVPVNQIAEVLSWLVD